MGPEGLEQENERLRQENARLLGALEEDRLRLAEPEEVVRAIRQGEIDALVVQEEIYSLQRFDSVYRAVVEECFPYGVWLAELDGRLLYGSPSFLTLLHTDLEEMRRKGQFHFLPPEDREQVERQWARCLETGEAYDAQYRVRFADGSERSIWTHGLIARTHDGVPRWAGINIDVTERERIKDELRQRAEALKEADRRKDEFLATLAHELRNPLATICNALVLLQRNDSGGRSADGKVRRYLEIIDRQVRHLDRLQDDLLDVARIASGKLRLDRARMPIVRAVSSALESCRPLIDAAGQELIVRAPDAPLYVDGDPVRLAQVVANLLANASKYTDRGGRICLTLAPEGDVVVLSVKDNGIGIAPKMIDEIFQMFSQSAPALERTQGGLGIGLALVRGLVQMHGGEVWARSDGPGTGSEFIVRLPRAAVPEGEVEHVGEPFPALPQRRVLIADDNRDAAETLAALLELAGAEVAIAEDGMAAVEKAAQLRPDVVLLDIGMPRMNGYEAAREIRRLAGDSVLLVALSGWSQEEDQRQAAEAGFDHYMTKPVAPAVLAALLARRQPGPRAD